MPTPSPRGSARPRASPAERHNSSELRRSERNQIGSITVLGRAGLILSFIRRLGGAALRGLKRFRFVWKREPDRHPEVIAAEALLHSKADADSPITLAFAYRLPVGKIDAYLADARVAGIVTEDAQHQSALPERLLNDPRVGRYWDTGWSLPATSRRVYFIGQWRLITLPMLLTAARGDIRVLRARCAYFWLGVPLEPLRAIKRSLARILHTLDGSVHHHAISLYRMRRRLARAILYLGPNLTWLAVRVKGELSLAGWSPDRVFRHMLRQPLPAGMEPLPAGTTAYRAIPRRIVLVCGSLQPGGAERQVAYTMAGLASKPVESVRLLCDYLARNHPNRYDFYLPYVEAAGGKARQIRLRISPGERRRLPMRLAEVAPALHSGLVADVANLYWEFLELRPEIVHAWLDWSNVRAGLAAALAGVPKVLISGRSLNPSHFALYATYMDPAYRALARCPNVTFLNNSMAGARDYADWLGIPAERIRVIHNGIEFGSRTRLGESEVTKLRLVHGIPENAFVVGGVFRFAAEKRPLLWIDAAKLIARQITNAYFILFGQGGMQSEMQARITAHGLADRFVVSGVTDDVLSALSMMDVFMLTSFAEGIPNVVLEAQSVGTPVVATNAGGTVEAVAPHVTGWIVEDDSPEALAECVHRLFADQPLRESVRYRGPEFVGTRFGLARMIEETWTAYGYGTPGAGRAACPARESHFQAEMPQTRVAPGI